METKEILSQIRKLPIKKRILIAEKTLHSVRTQEIQNQNETAARSLVTEYKTNKDLTSFMALDYQEFYETR